LPNSIECPHILDTHFVVEQDTTFAPCHAGLGWDELRLPTAVRPGDELDLEVTVLEKRESKSNSDRGIVRNQMRLRNQKREIVLQCINTVLVARRPDAKSST